MNKAETMVVEVPVIQNHEGFEYWVRKVRISKYCKRCGGERGKPYKTRSYDGSRFVCCDGWQNPCGHVDLYKDVVEESREYEPADSPEEK